MTTPRDPDEILAAWLEEGPVLLPDQTRRAIVVALPTIQQHRPGMSRLWRSSMHQIPKAVLGLAPRLAMGVAVVVAVVAVGAFLLRPATVEQAGIDPSPAPASTSSPTVPIASSPPATAQVPSARPTVPIASSPPGPAPTAIAGGGTFVSGLYGYGVRVPEGWTVTPASVAAVFEGLHDFPEGFDDDELDLHADTPVDRLWVASTAVPAGTDLDSWIATHLQPRQSRWGGKCGGQYLGPIDTNQWHPRTVADVSARERNLCGRLDIVLITGDRIYLMTARSGRREAMMDTLLATITFGP